jgi:hypothetical protein
MHDTGRGGIYIAEGTDPHCGCQNYAGYDAGGNWRWVYTPALCPACWIATQQQMRLRAVQYILASIEADLAACGDPPGTLSARPVRWNF